MKGKHDFSVIRFKENDIWSSSDVTLVKYDRITEHGMNVYWQAVDSAFKFNSQKHELFKAKSLCSANKVYVNKEVHKEDTSRRSGQPDEIQKFFHKHREHKNNRGKYHWHRRDVYEEKLRSSDSFHRNNRFILPKPH